MLVFKIIFLTTFYHPTNQYVRTKKHQMVDSKTTIILMTLYRPTTSPSRPRRCCPSLRVCSS